MIEQNIYINQKEGDKNVPKWTKKKILQETVKGDNVDVTTNKGLKVQPKMLKNTAERK